MKILVIGDSGIDVFIYGSIDRICPEAPVPVFQPLSRRENPGMAANVVANLRALDMDVSFITNTNKIKKIRYVDKKSNQMLIRVDEDDFCDRIDRNELEGLNRYDAIIISDYNKGFITEDDIKYICDEYNMVFIDTKKELGNWIINATYIKLNQYEYKNNRAFIKGNPEMFADKLLITYGEKGCYYQNKLYKPEIFAEVKDVCGAGDTFLSAFAVKRVKGASVNSAIKFAQKCASDVVSKRGVVTI